MTKSPQEQRHEEEQMQNVLLLLNHLVENEQTTVKLILDCLYEVGSLNLINQKIPHAKLNRGMRAIATLSKPLFRIVAFIWFKQNCPALIVDWLHSQVAFPPTAELEPTPPSPASDSAIVPPPAPQTQELERLQLKVKVLTSLCLGAMTSMTVLGSIAAWQMYSLDHPPSQAQSQDISTNPSSP